MPEDAPEFKSREEELGKRKASASPEHHPSKQHAPDAKPESKPTSAPSHPHRPPPRSDAPLETSLFDPFSSPFDGNVQLIGEFISSFLTTPHIEIEAKLGILIDRTTNMRLQANRMPVQGETILHPMFSAGMVRFESNMTVAQHQKFNQLLNARTEVTGKPDYKGRRIKYKHTKVIDSIYESTAPRDRTKTRVSRDESTRQVISDGIVRKVKLGELNVYCPGSPLDYRITVSQEMPVEMPKTRVLHTRRKDRLSYGWQNAQIDLTQVDSENFEARTDLDKEGSKVRTHELEVEIQDCRQLGQEWGALTQRRPSLYPMLIRGWVETVRSLGKLA